MILYCFASLFSFSLSLLFLLCVSFFTLGEIRFFKNPNFCKVLYLSAFQTINKNILKIYVKNLSVLNYFVILPQKTKQKILIFKI